MKKIWSDSYLAGWIENTVAGENPLQDPVELVFQCCGDEVEEADKGCVCIACEKNCDVKEGEMAKKITTLRQLERLVLRKKSVWVRRWGKPTSAAFLIHLPGIQLLRMFEAGMYEYKKERE